MRILHLADSHIGSQLVGRPRVARARRGDDLVASYQRVLDRAVELNVDLVIHAGDLFDMPAPSAAALAAATAPLLALAAGGIPIVITPGNHERSAIPGSLLLAHPRIYIATGPATFGFRLRGHDVAVSAIPCLRRDSAAGFAAALSATGWRDVRADLRILAVHQTFDGARCNSNTYRFRAGENVISRQAIPVEFDYVAAGHIHQQQVLATVGGKPIVYAGSCDRVSFAERDEPKGCMLLEVNGHGLKHRFIEHAVRPMLILPIDISGLRGGSVRDALAAAVDGLPAGAVAALRLTGTAPAEALDGLRVNELVRARRGDVLVSVTMRDVQWERGGGAAPGPSEPGRSAFACLGNYAGPGVQLAASETGALPTGRGVYALYDGSGRLLYVGKATNLRARVKTHVRARTSAAHFAGWSARIARIEVLTLDSDLEALLVEADLIRRLRPPFNRRGRSWRGYCYITGGVAPFAQLQLSDEPRGGVCFGPYRSRFVTRELIDVLCAHFGIALCPQDVQDAGSLPLFASVPALLCGRYYAQQCSGPCAGRVTADAYAARVERAHALLAGEDESEVLAVESAVAALAEKDADAADLPQLRRKAEILRAAFSHGVRLRAAEALRGERLIHCRDGVERCILLASSGPVFLCAPGDPTERRAVEQRVERLVECEVRHRGRRLAKAVVDGFLTAAQHMGR